MKKLTDAVVAYKLVWFRVSCYFIIPFVLAFLSATEKIDGDLWDKMHWFLKTRLFVACFAAGLSSIVAYIDSSLQRANERASELKVRRDREEMSEQQETDKT